MSTNEAESSPRKEKRPTDKRMPIEKTPYPIGSLHASSRENDNKLWGNVGDHAVFEHIGLRLQYESWTPEWARESAGRLNGELYEGLKRSFRDITEIEVGTTGSPTSMASTADFVAFRDLGWVPDFEDDAHFFVFRSRDGEWAGFRWRNESFRFRRTSLVGFSLHSALPARSSGGFVLWSACVLRRTPSEEPFGNVEAASFDLCDRWSAEVGYQLLSIMKNVANFLGTALSERQYMDV
ncbi:hypothetical protein [Burkholderia sp. Ac-20365]|uniref:hypothetical protein n=1 Tax=Burkholderia sp. Ac-20365 TaxID=2703897 RepID=UPI00197C8A9D|nr:hypothetical protein [Burkholderia sp. Ac-20365]MBN3760986.1 hypothetical protein [Burkholderia sp. Ac-20365]